MIDFTAVGDAINARAVKLDRGHLVGPWTVRACDERWRFWTDGQQLFAGRGAGGKVPLNDQHRKSFTTYVRAGCAMRARGKFDLATLARFIARHRDRGEDRPVVVFGRTLDATIMQTALAPLAAAYDGRVSHGTIAHLYDEEDAAITLRADGWIYAIMPTHADARRAPTFPPVPR